MDTSKLTISQKETFAILLNEGFDYNSSFEASIFYGNDIQNAREYPKSQKKSMRVNVYSENSAGQLFFS